MSTRIAPATMLPAINFFLALVVVPVGAFLETAPFNVPNIPTNLKASVDLQDVNIGAILSVSPEFGGAHCNGFKSSRAAQAQATLYSIEAINNDSTILPNITIGSVMLDDCFSLNKALGQAMHFIPTNSRSNSRTNKTCENTNNTQFPFYPVFAVVGPTFSHTSIITAGLLNVFKIAQISPSASSDALSDKTKYKYFSRVLPADKHQSQAMIDLIKYFNWTYISTINADGPYGEKGIKQVHKLAKMSSICIAYHSSIGPDTTDDEADDIARALYKNKKARVIVIFAWNSESRKLFRAFKRLGIGHYFIWILSDALDILKEDESFLEASFSVWVQSSGSQRFSEYFSMLNPNQNKKNVWFHKYIETEFKCSFSAGNASAHACNGNERVPITKYSNSGFFGRFIDCIYVAARALHVMIERKCPEAFANKKLLKNCFDRDEYLGHVRNITFDGQSGHIHFDKNGDMIGQYKILQLQKTQTGAFELKKVATWHMESKLFDINDTLLLWNNQSLSDYNGIISAPESVCAKPCGPGRYKVPAELKCCWSCRPCRSGEIVPSSRSESAVGRLSVASIYGIGCQQCHCQWKYILRPRKRCPHFRQHFCLFVSYLARSITSREMSMIFCFKSTFCRQIVSCYKYFLVK